MAKPKIVRPYYEVIHEFNDSREAFEHASMMLHNAVDTALSIFKSRPDKAGELLASLQKHADLYLAVTHGD